MTTAPPTARKMAPPTARRPARFTAVLASAVLVLVSAGCADQHDRAAATVEGERQSVEVELVDDAFRPLTVGAKAGLPLTVHLRNRGLQHHTFTDQGAGIDVDLGPGDEQTVEVPGLDEGSTRYFLCRFHEANGMKGKISYVTTL